MDELLKQFFETVECESPYDEDSEETRVIMRDLYIRDDRTWELAYGDGYYYDDRQGEYIYALIHNAYKAGALPVAGQASVSSGV